MKYKHILFDLDRTLWDFDNDTKATIYNIYSQYGFDKKLGDFEDWFKVYKEHNKKLWEKYNNATINKATLRDTRFYIAFKEFGIDDKNLGVEFAQKFENQSTEKVTLFPNAIEILEYLNNKSYDVNVVTNGFNEIQFNKIKKTGIEKYFNKIFTCENIGYNKPHPKFFQHALSSLNARKKQTIIIGDDIESDILGAKKYGIDQIFFKNNNCNQNIVNSTFTINSLIEIKNIL